MSRFDVSDVNIVVAHPDKRVFRTVQTSATNYRIESFATIMDEDEVAQPGNPMERVQMPNSLGEQLRRTGAQVKKLQPNHDVYCALSAIQGGSYTTCLVLILQRDCKVLEKLQHTTNILVRDIPILLKQFCYPHDTKWVKRIFKLFQPTGNVVIERRIIILWARFLDSWHSGDNYALGKESARWSFTDLLHN
ncbi:hypothetical protein BC832DRAFT_539988 [Gaertneriomyces semiglobifer]|nr:hypothetical protein BC832DRAFT_539988 [Gaertneriomyces semiglobifer]